MFLNYLSLAILCFGLLLVFYGFIYIHDIPHELAKKRHHPHTEAIHVACWLSLFTLHAIWPIVFIWAVYRPRTFRVAIVPAESADAGELQREINSLQERLHLLRSTPAAVPTPVASVKEEA